MSDATILAVLNTIQVLFIAYLGYRTQALKRELRESGARRRGDK